MTSDLDDLVRLHVEEVIRGVIPERPPFAAIRATAKRRRRSRTLAVACAATLVAGAAGIGIYEVNNRPGNLPPATTVSEGNFSVPTYAYRPGTVTNSIAFQGTLQFGPHGCPYIGEPGDPPGMLLAFPQGFEGHVSASGVREILDDEGIVWAKEGEALTIGPGGSGEEVQDSQGCISGARSEVNPLLVGPRVNPGQR